jgi:hypothetical protein
VVAASGDPCRSVEARRVTRINLASLDQASPLARRIADAIRRDTAEVRQRDALGVESPAIESGGTASGRERVDGGTGSPNGNCQSTDSPAREIVLHLEVVDLLRANALPGVFWTHFPAGEKRSEATRHKLAMMGTKAGVPDFLLIARGRLFGLELKTASGSLSKPQKLTHAALIRAGAEVAVCRTPAETAAALHHWQCIL